MSDAEKPWKPAPIKVTLTLACMLLGCSAKQLRSLKLRQWREGNSKVYAPEQIVALHALRDHWRKTTPR